MSELDSRVCTFEIGSWWCGVHLTFVREVVRGQPITRVPLAPTGVRGLINLRGEIITAVDLGGLHRSGAPADEELQIIIQATLRSSCSLVVDEVCEVVSAEASTREALPLFWPQALHDAASGAYRVQGRLLCLLAPERIERQQATRRGHSHVGC